MPQRTAYCVVSAFSVCLRNSRKNRNFIGGFICLKSVCTKTILIVAMTTIQFCPPAFADTSVDPVSGIRQFEGCVFDKTTHKKVKGAAIQIWIPGGSGGFNTTGSDGCLVVSGWDFAPHLAVLSRHRQQSGVKHYRTAIHATNQMLPRKSAWTITTISS